MPASPLSIVPLGFLLCVAAFQGAAPEAPRRSFSDAELAPLAEALAGYFAGRSSGEGLDGARADLVKALAALRATPAAEDPLALPADLGRAAWLAAGYDAGRLKPGKVVTEGYERGSFAGSGLELAWRLPDEYDPRGAGHALIVAIPDADEPAAQHLRARWSLPAVKERAIVICPSMPAERETWTRVMVEGRPGGVSHVLTALRIACERFAVDFDRIYVAGHGKSVPTALFVGNYSPQRFAGIVGRAGDLLPLDKLGPDNFGNLPLYLTGYGANATAFAEAATEPGAEVRLELGGDDEDVWAWMLEHPRRTYPTRVTVVPGDPFPTRAYWLRIAPSAPDARVVATLDRGGGAVLVDGHGASHATLYLNDALVDLERPLRFVCNGVETRALVPRRLGTALDLLQDATSDPSSVYVAEIVLDLSGEQPPSADAADAGRGDGFARGLADAGSDVAALWALYERATPEQRAGSGLAALHRIVRLAPDHEPARAALGHVRAAERWFTSAAARERFERRQDAASAEARGWIENRSLWMHRDQRPLASRGWVQDQETGAWLTVADGKRIADGWARQDLEWIEPAEAAPADEGRWRIGGEWFTLDEADRRHARLDSPWVVPGAEVRVHSTAERAVVLRAQAELRSALWDLVKVFGALPPLPLDVALVRDEEQFDRLAFGDPDGRRPPAHGGRLHAIHSAFFAESWFERVDGKLEFRGMGVGLWDAKIPHGDLYGRHSARLALGLSFVDALDPSPKAVKSALAADGPAGTYYADYLAEKTLPAWLRYGGAVYAERFFEDTTVAEDGDRWWARAWSLENLAGRGGLRPLDEVLAFPLDPDARDDGFKLLIEAGLVVAFVVDGGSAPVLEQHAKLKRTLAAGRSPKKDVKALEQALREHEAELRAFAGL